MTATATYDDDLSRVRITASGADTDSTYALVQRGYGGAQWATVRGGSEAPVLAGAIAVPVDDYEFRAGVEISYRIRFYDVTDVLLETQTATVTAAMDRIWLKFIARPVLNRPVTVTDWGDITRTSRNGIFDVIGRAVPVAITDVHSSRRFPLQVRTSTLAEADSLDLACSAGAPIYLHAPDGCGLPTIHAVIGDYSQARPSRRSLARVFDLDLIEVAAPGPDVVGAAVTWQTLLDDNDDWQAVLDAYNSWVGVGFGELGV